MNQISLAEYRQQIEDAIQDGRYEEAVAHGRHILERYPKDIGSYWLLGKAMLEAGQNDQAMDMFQRVLSANPEHMLAWVGMSETAQRRDDLEDAIWYLQRAFELATDNEAVAQELRRLYGELEGSEPKRLQLTESALAKLYLRGDLLTRAITELRGLVEDHPERLDLRVALAEALWRDGQRLQASQVCQGILDEQPYVLKANLILGEIWSSSGRMIEAEAYLDRAEALDPENEMAQELFGSASPVPTQEPQIEPITHEDVHGEEEPDWLIEMEKPVPAEVDETMGAEIEIPAWLQELAGEPAPEGPAEPEEEELPAPAEPEAAPPAEVTAPEEEEALEERLAPEQVAPETMPEEDVLDWLDELEEEEEEEEVLPGADEEEEVPAWLTEIEVGPEEGMAIEAEEAPEAPEPEPAEVPDWLRDLAPPAAEPPEAAEPEAPAAIFEEEAPAEEPVAEEPEVAEPEEMAELPAWLESDEMPSGDDALAWLAQLAEGKEDELLAQAEMEGEARLAEILGRPEAPAEEAPPAAEVPEAAEVEAEAPAPEEEAFGWTAFDEREEMAPEAEEAVAVEEAEMPEPEPPAPAEEEEIAAPEEVPTEVPPEVPEPAPVAEEVAPPIKVPAPEEGAPAEDLDRFIAAQQAYAEEHPDDLEAQLDLGRVLWQADRRKDAVAAYEKLIGRSKLLDDVIADLEDYTEQWPDARVMQSLGDAYVKADRLQDALDTYRHALESL